MNPKFPVYIISKGRAESRLTSKTLEEINVKYHIVIEPQEYEEYANVINPKKILTLPFSNLGQGSVPARNWVWDHSIKIGAKWHWILDDNIRHFYRLNKNLKIPVTSGTTFKIIEDFVTRYKNVSIGGFNYHYLCPARDMVPAFYLNTRIYSSLLIKNSIKHRWRGKYNEDTDLCLRVLKGGDCTILFNAFLSGKTPTLQMGGGNTEHVYIDGDNRYKFAESLYKQHPDVVEIVKKYGRWHHKVNYKRFQSDSNKLIRKNPDKKYPKINNYNMKIIDL